MTSAPGRTSPSRPLRVTEVAERLGCSVRTVHRELRRGKLRGYRVGRDWRVSPEALVEYEHPDERARQ